VNSNNNASSPLALSFAGSASSLDKPRIADGFRHLAAEIGATGFHVFTLAASREHAQILPCMDQDYPALSDVTRNLAATLLHRYRQSPTAGIGIVAWNAESGRRVRSRRDARTEKAKASEPTTGIAFSVVTERGRQGIVAFTGNTISLGADEMLDAHLCCHSLFAALNRLILEQQKGKTSISRRELECLRLTANGLTSGEIARKLHLSIHTANQYLANTAHKLNAVNRVHAVAKALRAGLID